MKLTIKDNESIADVQHVFEKKFPFLKLMFFKKSHKENEGSAKKDMINVATKLSRLKHKNGHLEFDENTTVAELEKMFHEHFGLNVQVFRKSGRSWIETTVTDDWTLKKQNDEGQELSELNL